MESGQKMGESGGDTKVGDEELIFLSEDIRGESKRTLRLLSDEGMIRVV